MVISDWIFGSYSLLLQIVCFSVSVIGFSMRNMLWINLVWGVGDFSGSVNCIWFAA